MGQFTHDLRSEKNIHCFVGMILFPPSFSFRPAKLIAHPGGF